MVLFRSRSRWLMVGSVVVAACGASSSDPGNERAPKPATATLLEDRSPSSMTTLDASPLDFPNGSWVVFGNTYEYTDSSGYLLSCPAAGLSGFKSNWSQGTPAVLRFQQLLMQHAVATGTDLVFLLENFCGHCSSISGLQSPAP